LVENSTLRLRVGEQAREDVLAHHTWEKNADELLEVLRG
jgi:glycosyltransferase involved in cell wall biosynthesis